MVSVYYRLYVKLFVIYKKNPDLVEKKSWSCSQKKVKQYFKYHNIVLQICTHVL